MLVEEIRAILARRQDGYARHDAAALARDYAEDCVVESPIAGRHQGRAAVEETLRILFSAFPDLRMETEEFLTFGNRAVWTSRAMGTDNGGFMGLPPTGKPFSTPLIFLLTFGDDGKIVHERRLYDFSRLLLHLADGAEPATEGPRLYRELLERAQRDHELKIAADIQRALLPPSRYLGRDFEVAATSVPCRAIGGDFFDYFTHADGAFSFVLGDVAGKGPPAALLAAVLQGIFTANAQRGDTPSKTIRQANDALVLRAIESRFATAVYATLSSGGILTYCNAGHNPPFLIGKHGVHRLETGGLVVGAFAQARFDEQAVQLSSGDMLVVYSDGLTEARNYNEEEFGEEGLLNCVSANHNLAPSELLECLLGDVHKFSAGTPQSDDRTVLVLRYSGASANAA